jgi:hypothetical protein
MYEFLSCGCNKGDCWGVVSSFEYLSELELLEDYYCVGDPVGVILKVTRLEEL